MVYKDEILKELITGEIYSGRQLKIFITYNDVVVLCDEVPEFTEDRSTIFKVVDVFSSYLHQYKFPDTYLVPNRKKKIYIVKKVEDSLW